MKHTSYAIMSVYDKTNIETLAKEFVAKNISIISSGGTSEYLKRHGIPVIPIEKITHSPESFDGRMKTISFQVASGILFDRQKQSHRHQAKQLSIPPIDFVIANVYPFWEKPSIEMIDIGGPTMIRAAAKNYQSVTVVIDPNDYKKVISQLKNARATTLSFRKKLAAKAFATMAQYDILISNYFNKKKSTPQFLSLTNGKQLRYGDNPHQKGFFFSTDTKDKLAIPNFRIIQGKQSSYSNILDVNAGIETLSLIGNTDPSCVILKHNNPCGAATAPTIEEAFHNAWYKGDPLAAFGSIVVLNRPVSKTFAVAMLSDNKFIEILVVPSFSKDALSVLSKKTRLQLWINKALLKVKQHPYTEIRKVRGGYLLQEGNTHILKESDIHVVTKKKPTTSQINDMLFAWKICQVSKSNTVVVAKDATLLSSGVGQQDRKRCCELCVHKAVSSLTGAVAASDGFFPFADGPEVLIDAGITAIMQPGGSIHDKDVIEFCDKKGIPMVFTGIRAFKH